MVKDNKKQQRSMLERFVGTIADKDKPLVLRSLIGIAYIVAIGLAIGLACDNLSITDIWRCVVTAWSGVGM